MLLFDSKKKKKAWRWITCGKFTSDREVRPQTHTPRSQSVSAHLCKDTSISKRKHNRKAGHCLPIVRVLRLVNITHALASKDVVDIGRWELTMKQHCDNWLVTHCAKSTACVSVSFLIHYFPVTTERGAPLSVVMLGGMTPQSLLAWEACRQHCGILAFIWDLSLKPQASFTTIEVNGRIHWLSLN